MKIFDCFTYYDEDILLDLRLNTLYPYVDKFVIIESKQTDLNDVLIAYEIYLKNGAQNLFIKGLRKNKLEETVFPMDYRLLGMTQE